MKPSGSQPDHRTKLLCWRYCGTYSLLRPDLMAMVSLPKQALEISGPLNFSAQDWFNLSFDAGISQRHAVNDPIFTAFLSGRTFLSVGGGGGIVLPIG